MVLIKLHVSAVLKTNKEVLTRKSGEKKKSVRSDV